MIELADKNYCTGCGACAYACPKDCIKMEENNIGLIYPVVYSDNCIDCKKCLKSCPIINPLSDHTPMKAFAAWSLDEEERRTSASGGIAAELYKKALSEGYKVAGAAQQADFSVKMKVAENDEDLILFKNSKYVFSDATGLFPQLSSLLSHGEKCIVIGLPCQIAAVRKLFRDNENLLLIDVVCHGITPFRYLDEHIKMLEKVESKRAFRMFFRDPDTYTYTFTFTLYDKTGDRFYAKRTKQGDTYQFGYHRMVSYRENCYHCHFAKSSRISDITLSDYKGLGKLAPCSYKELKVSSVLINTSKGLEFIQDLIDKKSIFAEERPVQEPIQGDKQLREPSSKSRNRLEFEKLIIENNGEFEKSIYEVLQHHNKRMMVSQFINIPKRIIKKLLQK